MLDTVLSSVIYVPPIFLSEIRVKNEVLVSDSDENISEYIPLMSA
jgi:hypothetical protein